MNVKKRRATKANNSTAKQIRANERHRKEKYIKLIADNFHNGDFFFSLFSNKNLTIAENKKIMKNFMRRFRREYESRTMEKIKFFRILNTGIKHNAPCAYMLVPAFADRTIIKGIMNYLWLDGLVKVDIYNGTPQELSLISSCFCRQNEKEPLPKIDISRGNFRL